MTPDLALAEALLREACGDRVRCGFPLAGLTTFRIGGPAGLYLEPQDERDLTAASRAVREAGVAFVVVGKGSNLLVSDAGFDGLVIRLGTGFRWSARESDELVAGGAMPLPALAGVALRHALSGLEFASAIPASLGGAVRMNAGAHGSQMSSVLRSADLYLLDEGRAMTVAVGQMDLSYRSSGLPEAAVVTGARLRLTSGDANRIRREMEVVREWRRSTQPVAEPNCGSVFKNPEGHHAARLIEEMGLKGTRVGGAHVSEKHANFIVANEGATSSDVWSLITLVREVVGRDAGILLEPEVRLVGSFPDA